MDKLRQIRNLLLFSLRSIVYTKDKHLWRHICRKPQCQPGSFSGVPLMRSSWVTDLSRVIAYGDVWNGNWRTAWIRL